MTMYRPDSGFRWLDAVNNVAAQYECSDRASAEVVHYAKVLTARGVPFSQMINSVAKYAKIRGSSDRDWDYA
jgi:hypothetical protein